MRKKCMSFLLATCLVLQLCAQTGLVMDVQAADAPEQVGGYAD